MKKLIALLLALVMIVGLVACGAKEEAPAAESGANVYKLGGVGPLTGGAAIYGNAAKNGAQIAVDEINAMGGIKLDEPSVDLAICAALSSAANDVPIDKYTALFGEVGLTGEIRAVRYADKRVNECIKTGFKRVILPEKNMKICEFLNIFTIWICVWLLQI